MENAFRKWQEYNEEITYREIKDAVTIQYQAFKGDTHIATIVVWSHKVNKSCMLIWREGNKTCQLCGSDSEARNLIEQ